MKILIKERENVVIRKLLPTVFFALLTGFGAQMRIPLPFTPVPITLQTLFVLSSGAVLGPFWGLTSQLLYLLLGIMGCPYFAGWQKGILTLLGPTGGYLLGFPLASYIAGLIAGKGELKRMYLGMVSGNILIYLFGSLWLGNVLSLSFKQALIKGVLPFIPGDIFKIVVGGIFVNSLSRWLKS